MRNLTGVRALLACLLAGVLVLAGCGGSDEGSGDGESGSASETGSGSDGENGGGESEDQEAGGDAGSALLDEVIAGAQEEGVVRAAIASRWQPDGIAALEALISEQYGVDLTIEYTPVGAYPERAATLVSEQAAGVTPSFDVIQSADTNTMHVYDDQAQIEQVDWEQIFVEGTPGDVVLGDGRYVVVYTAHQGLMYDPAAFDEPPTSLEDLTDPEIAPEIAIHPFSTTYAPWLYLNGTEETLATFREAMDAGIIVNPMAEGFQRFTSGEVSGAVLESEFYHAALAAGVDAEWAHLDYTVEANHQVFVPEGAEHPNAAKLLIAALASPAGHELSWEQNREGNLFYPDSPEVELRDQGVDAGLEVVNFATDEQFREYFRSEEGRADIQELSSTLRGN